MDELLTQKERRWKTFFRHGTVANVILNVILFFFGLMFFFMFNEQLVEVFTWALFFGFCFGAVMTVMNVVRFTAYKRGGDKTPYLQDFLLGLFFVGVMIACGVVAMQVETNGLEGQAYLDAENALILGLCNAFGVYLILDSIIAIVDSFGRRNVFYEKKWWTNLFTAAISLVIYAVMLVYPYESLASRTGILGICFILGGGLGVLSAIYNHLKEKKER